MIRFAEEKDIPRLLDLLMQVCLVHHNGRPDIFQVGTKYEEATLRGMLKDPLNPIFVCDEDGVKGYAFCNTQQHISNTVLTPIKTLYIDDLCVDEKERGKGIGRKLYQYVLEYAKANDYYNVTLNVWALNDSARGFYEHLGLKPLKTYMEHIL